MSASQSIAADRRWRPWELALIAALAISWFAAGAEHSLLGNEIAIFALFALSLDLILGYAGIISLGHAAFFGVGAYTTALIINEWTWPYLAAIVASGEGN